MKSRCRLNALPSDSKLTDSSVLSQKLSPLYDIRKSIAIIWKQVTIMDFWVNDDEGLTCIGLLGRTLNSNKCALVSEECWQLRCSKVVMASPAEGGNDIPTLM